MAISQKAFMIALGVAAATAGYIAGTAQSDIVSGFRHSRSRGDISDDAREMPVAPRQPSRSVKCTGSMFNQHPNCGPMRPGPWD